MLIEFATANFRSLHERQTFSLMKAKGDELVDSNTFKIVAANEFELLRSAVIYGPNAAGKSNLLLALGAMEKLVLNSASGQHGDKLPIIPFRLSQSSVDSPSEFEVTVIIDQVRYQYGFTATVDRIHEEWLLAYPKGRPQNWFARAWNPASGSYQWNLGSNLTGEKQLWQKATRDNALFLSTAVQLNSHQLRPLFNWFKSTLNVLNVGRMSPGFSAFLCESGRKAEIMEFLRAADLDIQDILIEKEPLDAAKLPDDMPEPVKEMIAGKMKDTESFDVKTVHITDEGEKVPFDLEDESSGTQKLFAFAGPWIDCLTDGKVLFVDELHDNLHPDLVKFLVRLFHDQRTNPKNAQLVFTTHDTSILNQQVFRRDQIWFCEKDSKQATFVYPLTDFSPRKGRENLELAYRSGRYGALPYVKPSKK